MGTKCIFLIISLGFITRVFAQDIPFENTNQALISLNPSFAGSNGGIRVQNYYRNQWPNLSGSYVTYQTCTDAYLKKIRGGLSVFALEDDQARGMLKTQQLGLSYAQHISELGGKLKIIPSIQISYIQFKMDVNSLTFGGMPNTRFGFVWSNSNTIPASSKSNLDFSTGLLANYKDFFVGATVKHFTQPDMGLIGVSRYPALYRVHASYNKKINTKTLLQFFWMINVQNHFTQVQLSSNAVLLNHLVLGLSYLSGDAIMTSAGYRNSNVSIQMAYSAVHNKLAGNTAGSWTATFSFNLRNKELRKELTNFENW